VSLFKQVKETFLKNIIFLSEPLIYIIKSFFKEESTTNKEKILKKIENIFGFSHINSKTENEYKIYFRVCFNKELKIWQLCESKYKFSTTDGFSGKIVRKSKRSKKSSVKNILRKSKKSRVKNILRKSKKK
jgi:hypothetical protein